MRFRGRRGDEHVRLTGGFIHALAGDERCSVAKRQRPMYHVSMITMTCERCSVAFPVRPYRQKTARFCSASCRSSWQAEAFLNAAPKTHLKGNQFRAGKRPANAFASEDVKGRNNPKWTDGDLRTCQHCAKQFWQKPWQTRCNGPARFCGIECRGAAKPSGPNAPDWVGGPRTYRGRGWLLARKAVVAEQGGCCDMCGKHVGSGLAVHHIRPFRLFDTAEEANVRSNLVGLCQSCHMKAENAERLAR